VKLRYTTPALTDLTSILDHIAEASPQGARRVQKRLQDLISLLPVQPRIGVCTQDPTIRRLTLLPYPFLIFYEVTNDEIIIHAVRHAARDPSGMPGSEEPT